MGVFGPFSGFKIRGGELYYVVGLMSTGLNKNPGLSRDVVPRTGFEPVIPP